MKFWLLPFVLLSSFCFAQVVNDGPGPGDINFQSSNSTLAANWSGFFTYATDTYTVEWATDIAFSQIVFTQTNVPVTQSSLSVSTSLTQGKTYYALVEVIEQTGIIRPNQVGKSNGVTVDDTNPTIGTVNITDINGNNISTQGLTTTIYAKWSGFSDTDTNPNSGIANYQWAIGSTSGGTDIQKFTSVGLSTSASNTNLNLTVGQTYYVTVKATNGSGLFSQATSAGVLILGGTVYDGPTAGVETHSQKSLTTISANWTGFNQPFDHYKLLISTSPTNFNSPIYTQDNISSGTTAITVTSGITLAVDTTYYQRIISENASGFPVETGTSTGITVISSPGPGVVFDGTTVGKETSYQSSLISISANWSGFTGPPDHYIFTVFEYTNFTTPIAGPANVGLVGTFTYTAALGLPALLNGATYFIQIQAESSSNAVLETETSNGVTVDTTTPIAGTVFDGSTPNQEQSTQSSTTTISANWTGFTDPVSGIADYKWEIGTTPGGNNVQAFVDVVTATSASNSSLTLVAGTKYYVTVLATSGSGAQVTATSPGVTVNTSAPTPGTVIDDGQDNDGIEDPFQASTTMLVGRWGGFTAPNGPAEYFVAVGTIPGGTNVYPLTGVGLVASATIYGLTLKSGTKYYFSVLLEDTKGLVAVASSPGTTVDASPPVAGTVFIGPAAGFNITSQFSTTDLAANWSGFSDAISGINHYEWAIGTTPGATNAQQYTSVGLATSADNNALSLLPGQTYYATVKAVDNVGNSVIASSNGVLISGGPPIATGGGGQPSAGTIGLGSLGSASCGSVGLDYLVFIGIAALIRNRFRRK